MKKIYCLLVALLCLVSAYAQNYRYVSADKLNLRSEPDKGAEVIIVLFNTAQVELIEEYDEEWSKVKAYGHEGYISSSYLVSYIGTQKGEPYFSLPTSTQSAQTTRINTESYTRSATSTAVKTVNVYICDSKSAYAYHSSTSCRGLNRCTHEIYKVSQNEAISGYGRRACQICY